MSRTLGRRQWPCHVGLLSLSVACSSLSGTLTLPTPPPKTHTFRAGTAKTDITPPPGIAMGGHGNAGRISRGTWTRLYARATYLEDADGNPLLLITCDLWSVSAGLADRVADNLARGHGLAHSVPVSRNQLILSATHTHQSPGNFSSSPAYNGLASIDIGFDEDLFNTLANGIAKAAYEAFEKAEPATLEFQCLRLPSITRNRSFTAFLLDPEASHLLLDNADLDPITPSTEYPYADAGRAVNGWAEVVSIRASQSSALLGVLLFIASHPTTMSHHTEVYNSDFFGVAAITLESALKATNPKIIVTVVNGAEGDISPRWIHQDRIDAVTLGTQLASLVLHNSDGPENVTGPITSSFTVVSLRDVSPLFPSPYTGTTAAVALAGAPMLGGAEDGRNHEYDLGWKEGLRHVPRTPGQGSKLGALDLASDRDPWFSAQIVSLIGVPDKVPLAVYQLGLLTLGTLPGEFTYVAGERIRSAIAEASHNNPSHVLLIGLADEYLSYFATPEEFEEQDYEGASTAWGPLSVPVVTDTLASLAGGAASAPLPRRYSYDPGISHAYSIFEIGAEPARPDDGVTNILDDLISQPALASLRVTPRRDYPRATWYDILPSLPMAAAGAPSVRLDINTINGWRPFTNGGLEENDEGLHFVTVVLAATSTGSKWVTFWLAPEGLPADAQLRFVITTLHSDTLCSEPFTPYSAFIESLQSYEARPCS